MARTQIAEKVIAEDLSGVQINFTDGNALSVNLNQLSDEIVTRLALHGLSQKLGDSYSGESDIAVARARAKGVADRLLEGDWRAARESSGGGRISDLAQALSTLTGKPVDEAATRIDEMDKTEKSALRKHPKIAAELARIAAERAADKAAKADAADAVDLAALIQ